MRALQTRTSEERSAELAEIFLNRRRKGISDIYTEEIGSALERLPVGPHDDIAARVLRYMQNLPIAGKDVIVSCGANGPWKIGVITVGQPGNLDIQDQLFTALEDAMSAVVRRRRTQLASY